MEKIKIILDCDPGHDDAVAILLAACSSQIKLLGISVVSGNQTIEKTSHNTLNICRYFGINVPISKGSPRPLVTEPMICEQVHGESGLDGFDFPNYEEVFDKRNGAELMIDLLTKNKDVTIVTTGPMTNLALALRMKPEISDRIKEIVFMGGSVDNGNVSPAAEFNILVDAEAAHICVNSGIPIKMIGLNITRKVLVTDEIIKKTLALNNKKSIFFAKLMRVFLDNQRKTFNIEGAPLHDPVTIASLIDDSLINFKKMNVKIDISHGSSHGRTNCDVFDYLHAPKNCYVAMDIDVKKFWNILFKCLRSKAHE
ncbi:MAG TPA: nucleoside hydrolase [Bacilli bacterium]|nr:nucleoside hydrolase [Bacilli bacterium]HQA55677.1 nucleoside hydrolase [Bacilli bacterium]